VARTTKYGTFVISVLAFDAAGNRSGLLTGGIAIDGPPPSSQAPLPSVSGT
jgi:hypothetical protein